MSYFGKSIIRGAGNEIGRSFARTAINKIAKGADANYVNVSGGNYGTSNRVKYNSTLNDQINKKLNTSFIEENKQKRKTQTAAIRCRNFIFTIIAVIIHPVVICQARYLYIIYLNDAGCLSFP